MLITYLEGISTAQVILLVCICLDTIKWNDYLSSKPLGSLGYRSEQTHGSDPKLWIRAESLPKLSQHFISQFSLPHTQSLLMLNYVFQTKK